MATPANGYSRPIGLPSDRAWIDPRLLAANLYANQTNVAMAGGVVTDLAGLNYDRWAIGFVLMSMGADTPSVAPFSDINTNNGVRVNVNSFLWYDQLTYGPLIGGEWFGLVLAPATVKIIEVIRLP